MLRIRVLLGVVLVLLAGCGGSNSGSTTGAAVARLDQAEWIRAADRLCARVSREVLALDVQARGDAIQAEGFRGPALMRRLAPIVEEQRVAIDGFADALERLGPPPREAERQLVEATREGERELAVAVAAMRKGKVESAQDAMQRYFAISIESAEVAGSTGDYSVCGSGA